MILTDPEVRSLKSTLHYWELFEYIATAIVGLGCVGEFVAEFTSLSKSKKTSSQLARLSLIILILGIAGELLGTVRTSQLSGQLVANIEERAGFADQKAGEANKRASANEKEAAQLRKLAEDEHLARVKLQGKIADAKRVAGEARERAGRLEVDAAHLRKGTEELRQRNLDTEARLAEEKRTRSELERSLIPRTIPFKVFKDKTSNVDDLRPFTGTEAVLEYLPNDFEAGRAADNIRFLIEEAGWKVVTAHPSSNSEPILFEGVSVEWFFAKEGESRGFQEWNARSKPAADALAGFLLDNDWLAQTGFTESDFLEKTGLKIGQIRIRVGLKPSPYFDDPKLKKVRDEVKKMINAERPNRQDQNRPALVTHLPALYPPIR